MNIILLPGFLLLEKDKRMRSKIENEGMIEEENSYTMPKRITRR
jgi:hypothetical protein